MRLAQRFCARWGAVAHREGDVLIAEHYLQLLAPHSIGMRPVVIILPAPQPPCNHCLSLDAIVSVDVSVELTTQ